jgi:anti-anti-sigma regulatory factor
MPPWRAAGWSVLVSGSASTPAELFRIGECVRALHTRGGVIVCDLSRLVAPDLAVVDALARLRLAARRLGADLQLWAMNPELSNALRWLGLGDAVAG